MKKYLNIDFLKKHYLKIHYFGLGFIQIKLDDGTRIHVYSPGLEVTTQEEEIHTHRYPFVSNILLGAFSQNIYLVSPSDTPTHVVRYESCNTEVSAPTDTFEALATLIYCKSYYAGDSYFMDPNTFHTVAAQDAITHLRRGPQVTDFAKVATPIGQESVCPFSVTQPTKDLFEIVSDSIRRLLS